MILFIDFFGRYVFCMLCNVISELWSEVHLQDFFVWNLISCSMIKYVQVWVNIFEYRIHVQRFVWDDESKYNCWFFTLSVTWKQLLLYGLHTFLLSNLSISTYLFVSITSENKSIQTKRKRWPYIELFERNVGTVIFIFRWIASELSVQKCFITSRGFLVRTSRTRLWNDLCLCILPYHHRISFRKGSANPSDERYFLRFLETIDLTVLQWKIIH